MGWLASLFGGGNPIKDAMDGLDNLFTSDDERLKGQAILLELEGKFKAAFEEQMTKRWQADMASDSWLSKNIRPGTWALMTVLLVGVVAASFFVPVDAGIKQLVQMAWITITGLYVPAREAGKALVNWQKKK